MEYRKLIKFGKSSFVVSIPTAWLKNNSVKKGDHLYLDERADELVLSTNKKPEREPKSYFIESKDKSIDFLKNEIILSYLNNYDIIEIRGELKENLQKVRTIISNLSGLEIIELTSNRLVAKDLLNLSEIDVKTIIRRMDIIIRAMLEDSLTSSVDNYDSIFERDHDINRLYYLGMRVVRSAVLDPKTAKRLKMNNIELLNSWSILRNLELIGDHTKRAARHLRNVSNRASQSEIKSTFGNIQKSYLEVMKSYHTSNNELAYKIIADHKRKMNACEKIFKKGRDFNTTMVVYNLRGIAASIKDIARRTVNSES